MFLMKKYNRRR